MPKALTETFIILNKLFEIKYPAAPYTVEDRFKGTARQVSEIYEKLMEEFFKFGSIRIEPKKTCIHICSRFAFAGIYTRKSYINLEFHLSRKLEGVRVSKVEQASANRFHHTVKLSGPKEVDKELISWLKEAYELKA
jgi:hypothetical protein